MLETIISQILGVWVIACAFGYYFSIEAQNSNF